MLPHRPRYTAPPVAALPEPSEELTCLVYEPLDAHDDTARIAIGQNLEAHWQARLSYLGDLLQVGREVPARAGQQDRYLLRIASPAAWASSIASQLKRRPAGACAHEGPG
jgi:hypothetical protein